MKKLLILSLVIFVGMNFYSCNDADSDFQEDINAAELYERALKSENQMDFFLSLNNKEKAAIWSHKYDLALGEYEWNSEQQKFINSLKRNVNSLVYDQPELVSTQDLFMEAMNLFTQMEAEHLLFKLENFKEGNDLQGRFWGWEVERVGDCDWVETNPGVMEYVAPAVYTHYVFWIPGEPQEGFVACGGNLPTDAFDK